MTEKIVSKDDIKKVATLARISLSKEEGEQFSVEINSILQYFKDLGEVNVGNYQPFDHYGLSENHFRKDNVEQTSENQKEATRKLFPKRRGDYLEVKSCFKILTTFNDQETS